MKPQLPYPCLTLITRLSAPQGVAPPDSGPARRPGYPMLTRNPLASTLIQRVREGVEGGVHVVQVREKESFAKDLYTLAQQLRHITADRALLLINDRIDVALAVGADGVHLPEDGLPVQAARRLLGEDKLIGCSVHNVASALQCAQAGADFVHVGTLYATDSKPGRIPAGPQLVRDVAAAVDIPVIGVGGISAQNAPTVMAAGAHGVAVISALLDAPDTSEAAYELTSALAGRAQVQPQ
ncbi:MAG: thiamine phosphate synthase [Chloroflexi bacterium]|nr:thiamine phosphate synthase [Chloroflexota bacterium]